MSRSYFRIFVLLIILTVIASVIAMPKTVPVKFSMAGKNVEFTLQRPVLNFSLFGRQITKDFELKEGLDIQGGMQVLLRADMKDVAPENRETALEAAKQVIRRRVDLFGVSEPVVQTAQSGQESRIIVELAGVKDATQALQLIGTTAQLDFRLQNASPSAEESGQSTQSAVAFFNQFETTGLTGKQLKSAAVQFDQQTGKPVVALEFNPEGREIFAKVTTEHTGEILAIFLDEMPVTMPRINGVILDGRAIITGEFPLEEAKQLAIQLNAGALPVPIEVIEQRSIGASLGQQSIKDSIRAGLIGFLLVVTFMIMYYGWKGFLASLSLGLYAILTIAVYKLLGVTLTVPGIAGLLLSIGMAVDANILIFERMKEELWMGKPFDKALQLGFGRAWDSIKDANIVTIVTALVLINPLDFAFLNTSGLVRGFGVTLLIGVLISLFTGMVVTRTLMKVFLKGPDSKSQAKRQGART